MKKQMKQILTAILVAITLSATAQQQPPQNDTMRYVLVGKLPDYELMYKAVLSPGDVTPNQKEKVLDFIRSVRALTPPVDSTKSKAVKKSK